MVYLVTTSGHPNYGDEVITRAWVSFYAARLPNAEIWVDTPRPGQTSALLRGLNPRLSCVDTLYHGCWNAPSADAADVIDFGERIVDQPGLIPREVTGMAVLQAADVIHVVGGGYINGIWPRHLALLSAARAMAARTGARTAITGAGLTPPAGSTDEIGGVLAGFDVVDVRDSPSLELLQDAVPHAGRSGDDAFLGLSDISTASEDIPATVICLQEDRLGVDRDDVFEFCSRTLRSWGVDDEPVLMLECLPPNDLHGHERLSEALPQLRVMPFDQLWRDGFPSIAGQRWISTRFHPHLIAAAMGSPGLAVSPRSGYYRTKHRSLIDLGSGWTLVDDLSTTPDPPQPIPPYNGRLAEIIQAKRSVADAVAAPVSS